MDEKTIPEHGTYGGPLTCAVAMYEDGTEENISSENLLKWQNISLELMERNSELMQLLKEARQRFYDYQMDVEDNAPQEHRNFMKRMDAACKTT